MPADSSVSASVSPSELLAKADAVFARRAVRRTPRPIHEELIGTLPAGPGQLLKVFRRTSGSRAPMVDFRFFAVRPDGTSIALTWGMRIRADALPQLAGVVAKALQADLDELAAAPTAPAVEE